MRVLRFFSPTRAVADLRGFFGRRHPHQLVFFTLAVVLTMLLLLAFLKDSTIPKPYEPNIIYVKSWPLDRSEAEILAQQRADLPKEQAQKAAIEQAQKQRQEEFKRLDEKLDAWGL